MLILRCPSRLGCIDLFSLYTKLLQVPYCVIVVTILMSLAYFVDDADDRASGFLYRALSSLSQPARIVGHISLV